MTNFYKAKSRNKQSGLTEQSRRRAPARVPSTGQFTLTKKLTKANPFQAGSHTRRPYREPAGILRHQGGHQRPITLSRARRFGNEDYSQGVPDGRPQLQSYYSQLRLLGREIPITNGKRFGS